MLWRRGRASRPLLSGQVVSSSTSRLEPKSWLDNRNCFDFFSQKRCRMFNSWIRWLKARVTPGPPFAAAGGIPPQAFLSPCLEELEQRLVPAIDLTISTLPTSGVIDSNGTSCFRPWRQPQRGRHSQRLLQRENVQIVSSLVPSKRRRNLAGQQRPRLNGIGTGLSLTIAVNDPTTLGKIVLDSRIFDSASSPAADALAVTITARGNLQVNASILAGVCSHRAGCRSS